MATYDTGTVTFSGTTVNGSGVNWQTANNPVRPGNTLLIMSANEAFTVVRINSSTQLVVNRAPSKAITKSVYCLLLTDALSNDALAQRVSEMTRYYEKQVNAWGKLITASDDVSIVGPDGNTVKIPSIQKMHDDLGNKVDKSQNLADVTDKAKARKNLGLGTSATVNVGANNNEVLLNGAWGLGGSWRGYKLINTNNINPILNEIGERGLITFRNNQEISNNGPGWYTPAWGPSLWCRAEDVYAIFNMASTTTHLSVSCGSIRTGWTMHKVLWHSLNTVVDGNGFIKKSSPVTKVFGDGTCENNMESEGVVCTRVDVGVYHVDGCLGFYSDNGWKFEVPKDENGSALLWVDYTLEEDGSITFRTFHRANDCPIPDLQNNVDGYKNGDPIDIPKGKFLMVRLNVPNSQLPEYVPDISAQIQEIDDLP